MQVWQTTRKVWRAAAALLLAAAFASTLVEAALAQGMSPGPPAPCAPSTLPGTPGSTTSGQGEPHNPPQATDNLSGKLAQSDGVICPPAAVDPDIRLPTPETGNTPVIPPPGSPGGDQSIRPK